MRSATAKTVSGSFYCVTLAIQQFELVSGKSALIDAMSVFRFPAESVAGEFNVLAKIGTRYCLCDKNGSGPSTMILHQ